MYKALEHSEAEPLFLIHFIPYIISSFLMERLGSVSVVFFPDFYFLMSYFEGIPQRLVVCSHFSDFFC